MLLCIEEEVLTGEDAITATIKTFDSSSEIGWVGKLGFTSTQSGTVSAFIPPIEARMCQRRAFEFDQYT